MGLADLTFKVLTTKIFNRLPESKIFEILSELIAVGFGIIGIIIFWRIGYIFFNPSIHIANYVDDDSHYYLNVDDKVVQNNMNNNAKDATTTYLKSVFVTTFFTEIITIYLHFVGCSCSCCGSSWYQEKLIYENDPKSEAGSTNVLSSVVNIIADNAP